MKIKPELLDITFEQDDDGWYNTTMAIHRKGEIVEEHWDGGEPEDNTFGRDWSWVDAAIERAYKWGVEDGKSGEYDDVNA